MGMRNVYNASAVYVYGCVCCGGCGSEQMVRMMRQAASSMMSEDDGSGNGNRNMDVAKGNDA